jgi:hypothetical protein
MPDRPPQGERGGMNSTVTFALATEHRADLLTEVADLRRIRAARGGPAHGHVRVPRVRPRWWRRATVRTVQP